MRLKKALSVALLCAFVISLALSVTPVAASHTAIDVTAEGYIIAGGGTAPFNVAITNNGNEKVDNVQVTIQSIGGKALDQMGIDVTSNPISITDIEATKTKRKSFVIKASKNAEIGEHIVELSVLANGTRFETTGKLYIEESEYVESDINIGIKSSAGAAPNQNIVLRVEIENPASSSQSLEHVSLELVGIASDPDYTDLKPVTSLTAEEAESNHFFRYAYIGEVEEPLILKLEKDIEPGDTETIQIQLATGKDLDLGIYYPVYNVTFDTTDSDMQTIEVRNAEDNRIEISESTMFIIFNKPFQWFLDMLKDTVGFGNYGLAIIILGILLKIILIPLTNIQFNSMRNTAKIQPLIKKLNEKYPGKENAQKRQEETMKIYKENNVNMFGGCLPMLVQLPIIIALYNAISGYAPFNYASFLWLPSLGAPDPVFIMPVLMAASTWFQQKVSAMPGQEQNMAMQIIMPLFLGYIALQFPSALTIYWVTFTLASIIHQMIFNKKTFGEYIIKIAKPTPKTVDSKEK
ncbi:MAG TPA: membrane protein insertase YidC [Caldisericia bacterium]|nr:membrane protein insertase YidC [Caldisericia bacterium]HPF48879.1 membrane protein insertase YidC [Caldisericia bacterium]HPI83257.1 membrane protein insertase YidC [Caldisericia bacterium]HPQ92484.1 membrane protein insertase YidC [Caldisericia bacterium]HRV74418.1 membrane protein insertase YidC [Caldisericia bacterium]